MAALFVAHGVTGLPDGKHSFEVRAVGTGGRPDPTPAKRDWVVDTTGPDVTATSPKDGATNASPGTELTATFSEAIDPASGHRRDLRSWPRPPGGGDREGDLRPGHPQGPAPARQGIAPAGRLRATITAGVKDRVGNAMPEDHVVVVPDEG